MPITGQDSCYASATLDKSSNEIILKIVNSSDKMQQRDIVIEGTGDLNIHANQTLLKGEKLDDINSFTEPAKIKPFDGQLTLTGKQLSLTLPPYSLQVIRIKII